MTSKKKSVFADRPYGHPPGISARSYAKWYEALNDMRTNTDAHAVSQRYLHCCHLLESLADTKHITEAEHHNMRAQLNDVWAEAVVRLEQPGSTFTPT